jgi:hypothetical protein
MDDGRIIGRLVVIELIVIEQQQQLRRWLVWRRRVVGLVVRAGVPGCIGAGCLALSACAYTPAAQQRARIEETLRSLPNVVNVVVACEARVFVGDELCAALTFSAGRTIHFARVGTRSFGSKAAAVVVTDASGLVPRVASCSGIGPPNFHRDAPFGHHFQPPLVDMTDAVTRYRQILKEVDGWPQCPQYFELQDHRGVDYRYCARSPSSTSEPSRPNSCQ